MVHRALGLGYVNSAMAQLPLSVRSNASVGEKLAQLVLAHDDITKFNAKTTVSDLYKIANAVEARNPNPRVGMHYALRAIQQGRSGRSSEPRDRLLLSDLPEDIGYLLKGLGTYSRKFVVTHNSVTFENNGRGAYQHAATLEIEVSDDQGNKVYTILSQVTREGTSMRLTLAKRGWKKYHFQAGNQREEMRDRLRVLCEAGEIEPIDIHLLMGFMEKWFLNPAPFANKDPIGILYVFVPPGKFMTVHLSLY